MLNVEIKEHPTNETLRRKNSERLDKGRPAMPLITDQFAVLRNGVIVGYLNIPRNKSKKPGVALIITIDDETREAIDRAVQAHLEIDSAVAIGQAPTIVEDEDTEIDDE